MDLIRKRIEKLNRGCITGMWGLTVWRIADRYIVGNVIKQSDAGLTLDEAVEYIYKETQKRNH